MGTPVRRRRIQCRSLREIFHIKLPTIDISSLPDLDTLTGMFGSAMAVGPGHNDTIVILATVVYESAPSGII